MDNKGVFEIERLLNGFMSAAASSIYNKWSRIRFLESLSKTAIGAKSEN